MEVRIRTVPAMRVACTSYEGPLDKVGSIFDRIQEWMRVRDAPDHPVIGVFVETRQPLDADGNPAGAPDGRAEAWIELPVEADEAVFHPDLDRADGAIDADPADDPSAAVGSDVVLKDVPEVKVAATLFEGHPLDLIVLQDQLRRFLRQKGLRLGPETRFVYLDADFSRINQWTTEVQVPLLD